jgi:ribosome recycling factor
MSDQIIRETKQKMQASLDAFQHDLVGVRTGRAAPSLIENLAIEVYGSVMKLQEIASITAPDAAMLVVQPWDAGVTGSISKAIQSSELNLNPVVDGSNIRVPLPPLTQERRLEFVKLVGKKTEEAHVSVRSVRQDALGKLKRAKDDGDLSQDEQQMYEKRVQEVVDDVNKQIDALSHHKEQELLKI